MKIVFGFIALFSVTATFAQVNFSESTDIDKSHSEIRLSDVQYRLLPSKTETRRIPGCRPTGNSSRDCNETVVLERQAAVQVSVSYNDGVFRDTDRRLRKHYLTLNLRPEIFSNEALNELMGARRGARMNWAAEFIELKTKLVTRDVQVIDFENSRFCPIDNEPYPRPGCVEVIIYKAGKVQVREVRIIVK